MEFEHITIPKEGYVLQPGECYLGSTQEIFGSNTYASLVTGRSSIGRKFITNHITAGLIDQGFFGNITLEIVVQRPTRVYSGMAFGQIFWFSTCGVPILYAGKYQRQCGPTLAKMNEDYVSEAVRAVACSDVKRSLQKLDHHDPVQLSLPGFSSEDVRIGNP